MKTFFHSTLYVLATTGVAHAADKAQAPVLAESPLSDGQLLDTLGGLVVVLVLLVSLAWLVKRYVQVPGINKGHVRVIGGASLGPRERAVLVSVDGVRLLLGVAPGRVQTLHVLGPAPETGAAADASSFDAALDAARGDEQ